MGLREACLIMCSAVSWFYRDVLCLGDPDGADAVTLRSPAAHAFITQPSLLFVFHIVIVKCA